LGRGLKQTIAAAAAATQDAGVPDEAVTYEFEDEPRPTIIVRPEQIGGVWANWARVTYATHEFTIDLVRPDPFSHRGIVVARIAGSADFVQELTKALNVIWHHWARTAMPPEVNGGDGEEPPEAA
jgi:hypothetical protein